MIPSAGMPSAGTPIAWTVAIDSSDLNLIRVHWGYTTGVVDMDRVEVVDETDDVAFWIRADRVPYVPGFEPKQNRSTWD